MVVITDIVFLIIIIVNDEKTHSFDFLPLDNPSFNNCMLTHFIARLCSLTNAK